jgi:hypothetical protein
VLPPVAVLTFLEVPRNPVFRLRIRLLVAYVHLLNRLSVGLAVHVHLGHIRRCGLRHRRGVNSDLRPISGRRRTDVVDSTDHVLAGSDRTAVRFDTPTVCDPQVEQTTGSRRPRNGDATRRRGERRNR